MPGWDKAPDKGQLTIVFTLIENMEQLEKLVEEEKGFPLEEMMHLYQTQVSFPPFFFPHLCFPITSPVAFVPAIKLEEISPV
jgi:hypothetical protein